MGLLMQLAQVFMSPGQDFVGFLKKDFDQLGIDFLGGGLCELDGFCRWRGSFRCLRLELRHGRVNLLCGVTASSQRREYMFGLLPEFLVGDQIGIFLQGRQILSELLAQPGIAGLLLEGHQQGVRIALLLLQFLLDACCRVVHLADHGRLHLADESREIACAVLHGIDEETNQRQLLGNAFEVGHSRYVVRFREACDVFRTLLQNGHCIIVAHHGKRTDDLSQRGFQSVQIGTFFGIAEKAIENLLDLCEVVGNLPGDLGNEHPFLCQA
ncbi:MAG: hypothetical protein AW09_003852 [Candidatus Accumulibacter phosphatis]|uniref:Uncharacterized protein n=1 Tax=Candidatus Accumulibacter phosphatis TaxID=327160 RepID=A0A080LRY2_9PROT|nr:MAG: hypothetical protein AW09_003852 [Candidatus Accumulibacter phosphatis]